MVTAIDDVVKVVADALEANNNMMDNTIIVFSSDNGGQPLKGGASNTPLRGGKNTWFEGGMRVPSWAYSPLFESSYVPSINNW